MSNWRNVHFSNILEKVDRRILLNDTEHYSCVGVRWYGMGAFVREKLLGAAIARKQQWVVQAGDVIYNKLFAWKGAFAIADNTVDGCIASDKFPTYRANTNLVDHRWLGYFFKTPFIAKQAKALSKGAAAISKLTLNPPQFWELLIPLPPLDEQQRIVSRLEELTTKIHVAKSLRQEAIEEVKALIRSRLQSIAASIDSAGRLGEVLATPPRNGWSAKCDNADGGIPVLSLAAVTGYRYRSSEIKHTSLEVPQGGHFWLKKGDLLITRSNTPDLVGHAAIYDGNPSPCIYPDLMMRIDTRVDAADPKFVWYWLQSPLVREFVSRSAKGTSSTMKKISQATVTSIPFPLTLPVSAQRRIVAELDSLQEKVDALKCMQGETEAELDALLPSVLDHVFRGEMATFGDGSVSPLETIERRARRPSAPKQELVRVIVTKPIKKHSKGLFYRRAALDCYIISALAGDPNLGRTKIEKLSHLLEYHCGVDLEREPVRDAAGPNDYPSRRKVESLARKLRWYVTKNQASGAKVDYVPGPEMFKACRTVARYLRDRKPTVDSLLSLMRPLDTKQSEIIATLYAAWNDFLLVGKTPSDAEIVKEVRTNWHPEKRSISTEQWLKALAWMRKHHLVPRGVGRATRPISHDIEERHAAGILEGSGEA